MFNLFYNNNTIKYASYIDNNWRQIQRSYNVSYKTYLDKARIQVSPVNNAHILNRILLHLINILPTEKIDETTTMSYIDMETDTICRIFKLTNISSKGVVHNDGIYKGSKEVFVSTNLDIPYDIHTMWDTISAVECIHHTSTELTICTPNLLDSTDTYIWYIDFKLLYLQYMYWRKVDGNLDTRVFISQITLPLTLPSIIDISIINRYIKTYKKEKIKDDKYKALISVNKYEKSIEKLIKKDLDNLKDKNINYIELLSNMSVIFENNSYKRLRLNDYLYNSNNKYVLWLSRIEVIEFMFNILGDQGTRNNRLYITMLQGEIIRLNNTKHIRHLPTELILYIEEKINNIDFM